MLSMSLSRIDQFVTIHSYEAFSSKLVESQFPEVGGYNPRPLASCPTALDRLSAVILRALVV